MHKASVLLFRGLASLVISTSVLFAFSACGVLSLGSPLSGASYLPPSWLCLGVVPVSAALAFLRSFRWAIATMAAFVVLVLPRGDFSVRTQRDLHLDGPRLSVVALNVRYYSHGLENVVRALNQLDVDVYLLSENVLDAAGAERAKALFAPRDFRMGRAGETAIVSRYPILSFKEVDLPSTQVSLSGPNSFGHGSGADEHRSFSHALLDVKGTHVNVVSVRFIAGRAPEYNLLAQLEWGAYLVREQAEELAAFERYVAQQQGPLIFGGDINAPPSATIVKALSERFTDAYLAQHYFGTTTFRVGRVSYLRLDYIFSSRNVQPLSSRRVDVEVSDHYPVFAEFALPRGM